jgi:tetratricopeptide (TPR) repeat protein
VQQDQGDLEGARASFERALAIRETVYGRQHLDTALTLGWLGVLAQKKGNIDQARDYLEETLAIYKQFLPPNHPRIQKVRGHLEALG